jgi:hypothetical protein
MQQDRGRPVAEEGGRIRVVHNGGQEEDATVVDHVTYYFYYKRNQFLVLF